MRDQYRVAQPCDNRRGGVAQAATYGACRLRSGSMQGSFPYLNPEICGRSLARANVRRNLRRRMRVYFSHSYRDTRINAYFDHELREQGFQLVADQKSSTWCVAKIERYLSEQAGFISVIPRRMAEAQAISFSPYIGSEITLARRSGLPRLLFVDDEILSRYRTRLPVDAVPFVLEAPESDGVRHQDAIRDFKRQLDAKPSLRRWRPKPRKAMVVAAGGKLIGLASQAIVQTLAESYEPTLLRGKQISDALDEVSLFEKIIDSELCVFVLDSHLSNANVVMAMAHAHSIPSIRTQYDVNSTSCEPALSGLIRWSNIADFMATFKLQIDGFRKGFVEAIDLRAIATTQWNPTQTQLWDPHAPEKIIDHLYPAHYFVQEEVARIRRIIDAGLVQSDSRKDAYEVCNLLYNEFRRFHFAYEIEPQMLANGKQAIRSASEIRRDNAATCLDLACFFSSLLKAANREPVIILLGRRRSAHALVGYRAPAGLLWDGQPEINDLRAAVKVEDIVIFEPTGAVESDTPVGAETEQERRTGGKMLDFETAVRAAKRLIASDVELRYFVSIP
jgi:hypothetical protein